MPRTMFTLGEINQSLTELLPYVCEEPFELEAYLDGIPNTFTERLAALSIMISIIAANDNKWNSITTPEEVVRACYISCFAKEG